MQWKKEFLVPAATFRCLTSLAGAALCPSPALTHPFQNARTVVQRRRIRYDRPLAFGPVSNPKAVPLCTGSTGAAKCDSDSLGEDDGSLFLAQALQRAEQRDFETFRDQEAPSWLQSRPGLPFKCTECGKCCLTKGHVFLSPHEVAQATQLLGLPAEKDFVQTYASHILKGSLEGQTPWIRLKEKAIVLTEKDDSTKKGEATACIFLDPTNMHCQIYEARPTQCRTYPFWSPILKSMETWNDECRRKVEDDFNSSNLPLWNPTDGGCEGMQRLDGSTGSCDEDIVPIADVYQQLYDFVRDEKRYPTEPGEHS